ncbi:MAG: leucine-rich repeat domain-containing protein, partial [Lachnospiraceae bacterium]|nr:leucine-rich repeat domain-containing protein [Lachnospiraceae bacterium]
TGAFVEMNSLREIAIPEGVEEIGEGAFYKCASLKHITVPGTVKKIGKHAFLRCRKLERVYVCDGVSEIGDRAFLDCSALKTARIPQSVQNLRTAPDGPGGYGVFNGCKKLTVHGPKGSDIEKYCREMGILFEDSAD